MLIKKSGIEYTNDTNCQQQGLLLRKKIDETHIFFIEFTDYPDLSRHTCLGSDERRDQKSVKSA